MPRAPSGSSKSPTPRHEGQCKKGFVLVAPKAAAGEPLLHVYLGGGYTGALALTAFDGRLLSNRHVSVERGAAGNDELVVLGTDGGITQRVPAPPGHLVWEAVHVPALGRVLLRCDRSIHFFDPSTWFDASTIAVRTDYGAVSLYAF